MGKMAKTKARARFRFGGENPEDELEIRLVESASRGVSGRWGKKPSRNFGLHNISSRTQNGENEW